MYSSRVVEWRGRQYYRGVPADLLTQPELLDLYRRSRPQQDHLRLPPGDLRLAHVDQRRAPDVVARLGELLEFLVVLQLLARDLAVVPRLQHRQVLLGDGRDEVRLRARDVGVRRRELRLAEPRLGERLSAQAPVQTEAVTGGQGGDALREVRREKRLLAGAGVSDPPRRAHAGDQHGRPRAPRGPGGGGAVVDRLPVQRVVGTGEGDGVGERELRGNGALAHRQHRADGEPDGAQQKPHGDPWTGRWDDTSYAARAPQVSTRDNLTRIARRRRPAQRAGCRAATRPREGISTLARRPAAPSQTCTSRFSPPVTVMCRSSAGSRFSVVVSMPRSRTASSSRRPARRNTAVTCTGCARPSQATGRYRANTESSSTAAGGGVGYSRARSVRRPSIRTTNRPRVNWPTMRIGSRGSATVYSSVVATESGPSSRIGASTTTGRVRS